MYSEQDIFVFLPKNLLPAPSVITKYGVLHTIVLLIKKVISSKCSNGINWHKHIPHHPETAGLIERLGSCLIEGMVPVGRLYPEKTEVLPPRT